MSRRALQHRVSFAAAIALTCSISYAAPFECAPVVPDRSMQPPYHRVSGQGRCEGFFSQTVSQKFVELVSLTLSPRLRSDGASGPLSIRVPRMLNATPPATLVIRPLGARPFYRVDMPISRKPTEWDPAPMLTATGLQVSNLGFLAVTGQPEPGVTAFTPVAIDATSAKSSDAFATVRVSVKVTTLRYRQYALSPATADTEQWREVRGTPLYAWDRSQLQIPLPADDGGLRVDVEATDDSGRNLPLLRFIIVGQHEPK